MCVPQISLRPLGSTLVMQARTGGATSPAHRQAVVFMTPSQHRVPRTVGALASLLGYLPKVIVLRLAA